jgi:hypothetical protein
LKTIDAPYPPGNRESEQASNLATLIKARDDASQGLAADRPDQLKAIAADKAPRFRSERHQHTNAATVSPGYAIGLPASKLRPPVEHQCELGAKRASHRTGLRQEAVSSKRSACKSDALPDRDHIAGLIAGELRGFLELAGCRKHLVLRRDDVKVSSAPRDRIEFAVLAIARDTLTEGATRASARCRARFGRHEVIIATKSNRIFWLFT